MVLLVVSVCFILLISQLVVALSPGRTQELAFFASTRYGDIDVCMAWWLFVNNNNTPLKLKLSITILYVAFNVIGEVITRRQACMK